MAICRWSCDDSRSNVYVYEVDCGRVAIHVSHVKTVHPEGKPPPRPTLSELITRGASVEELKEAHERYQRWVDELVRVPINTNEEDFPDMVLNYEDALAYLKKLVDHGYHVTEYAFQALKEMIEMNRKSEVIEWV